MNIFSLSPNQIAGLLLIIIRIGAIAFSAPVLSDRRVPMPVKAGVSILLAFILLPLVSPVAPEAMSSLLLLGILVVKEVLVGVIIGFSANLLFQIVQMASEMQDLSAGFGFAGMVDPQMQHSSAILGQFQMALVWMIFFAVNGHHVLMQSICDSFAIVPLGGFTFDGNVTARMVALMTTMLMLALRMSAPVLGSMLLADLAMGMLQRTAPQLNLMVVGFPVKIALTFAVIFLTLPHMLPMQRDLVPFMHRVSHEFMQLSR